MMWNTKMKLEEQNISKINKFITLSNGNYKTIAYNSAPEID